MGRFLYMIVCIAVLVSPGAGTEKPTLRFSPESQTVPPDASVIQEVRVESVTALKGYSVHIRYDPSLLIVRTIGEGSMFGSPLFFASFVDSVDGVIKVESALLGSGRKADGSGLLFTVEVSGRNKGTDTLSFFDIDLRDVDLAKIDPVLGRAIVSVDEVSVVHPPGEIPRTAGLFQNYPNPFNPVTTIPYRLAERSAVTIEVFNATGELVARPVSGEVRSAGLWTIPFDADGLPSGIYYYRMVVVPERGSGIYRETKRMALIR
jgi:hypothetical protein